MLHWLVVLLTFTMCGALSTPSKSKATIDAAIEEYIKSMVDTVRNETEAKWLKKFEDFQAETTSRFERLEKQGGKTRARSRRDLNAYCSPPIHPHYLLHENITSLATIRAVPLYVPTSSNFPGITPNFFPSTSAQGFLYFIMTPSNSLVSTSPIGHFPAVIESCLAQVSYQRCVTPDCAFTTKNHVAQNIFSWDPFMQRWQDIGPGASGSQADSDFLLSYRPVVANGVKGLTQFSPDGVNNFVVPAAFDEDLGRSTFPTSQCGDVWIYTGLNKGWKKYQDCSWKSSGSRSVKAFQINGEQYIIHTNMVSRQYSSSNLTSIVSENYTQPSFIFKWSSRTQDNFGTYRPFGFFLTGGETSGGTFSPGDAGYSPEFGNNGANVFQIFSGLKGVADVEVFDIYGQAFLAFSEHISNEACGDSGLGDGTLSPSCQTVALESRIYMFNSLLPNPRGDCLPASFNINITGCQSFRGEFELLQTIPTYGARSMHYFKVSTSETTHHFLAVAEHRSDLMQSVNSSIWRWNGQQFGLFQRIETNYAIRFSSFVVNTETFLAVTNRGCPEIERQSEEEDLKYCDSLGVIGRTRIWAYDSFRDSFTLVPETSTMGTLAAYGADFQSVSAGDSIESLIIGPPVLPEGIETFQLPSFSSINGFGAVQQYLAIANSRANTTSIDASGHYPENAFNIGVNIAQGVLSQLSAVTQAATDNALFLTDLKNKLDGGADLLNSFRELFRVNWFFIYISSIVVAINNPALNIRTYSATSSRSFQISGTQYVAVASDESYMTYDQCLDMYTDVNGPATECQYLSPQGLTSTAVAELQHCAQICSGGSQQTPVQKNHRTSTIIYRVGEAKTSTDSSGNAYNLEAPSLIEVQQIPSLGVNDVYYFVHTEPATQSSYEACSNGQAQYCYNVSTAVRREFLVISNTWSSCEYDNIRGHQNPRDPNRGARIYQWNVDTLQFVYHSSITGCQIKSVRDFTTECQRLSTSELSVPTCASYLAVVEDCSSDIEYMHSQGFTGLNASSKITFHKWDASSQQFIHCQPYEDPGDERNQLESICFQPTDGQRSAAFVSAGDRHAFDFPDLLPSTLQPGVDFLDDGTGYVPQLRGTNASRIEFGVPKAQKDIYLVNTVITSSSTPLSDSDQEPRTLYYVNGRRRFELIFSIAFDDVNGPQIFALDALFPADPICASNHPTTPRRRLFALLQTIPVTDTSGGRDVSSFERITLGGILNSYFVFPELRYRAGVAQSPGFGSSVSSVYTNSLVCDEYTQHTLIDSILNSLPTWGTLGPANDANLPNGDSKYCPYSLDLAHYEAWEAFYNFYHPVSPCKGKYANVDGSSSTISQQFYNAPPPASLLSQLGDSSPSGPYAYSRSPSNAVTLPTFGYSSIDYEYLHDNRDAVLAKLQDLPTFGATSVSVLTLCGAGPVFLLFGQSGYNSFTVPSSRRLLYVWNDRFAVDSAGMCSAAGSRAAWQASGNNILSVKLGCFEFSKLFVPINNGAASSITMFQSADYLLVLTLNHGQGLGNVIDPGACSAGGAALNRSISTVGVTSPIWSIDLSVHGGVQCRQYICCANITSEASSVIIDGKLSQNVINQLRGTFVDLSTDQNINGSKTFTTGTLSADSLQVRSSLFVSGETTINNTLYVNNIETSGLIDGVDVSIFFEQSIEQFYFHNSKLALLAARLCNSSGCHCTPFVVPTSCYPKASLNAEGFSVIKSKFRSFASQELASNGVVASIVEVYATPLNPNFIVILQSCLSGIHVNGTKFSDSCLCQKSKNVAASSSSNTVDFHVYLHNITCDAMDLDRAEKFRLAIANALSQYGTRQNDVLVTAIACKPTQTFPPGLRLSFTVSSASTPQALISSDLILSSTWMRIYNFFIKSVASICFPTADFTIEFLPNQFVPYPGSEGSGDNDY